VVAQATGHAESIAEAVSWRAEIALWRREFRDALEQTTAARVLATEHGFPTWLGQATISHGWVLSEQGRGAEGVAQIHDGLSFFAGMSDELFRPYYLAKLADALARSGQVTEGLATLDEVIESYRQSGVPYWDSELQRRKGELLLAVNNVDRPAAEACFRRAIEIAQGQSARSLELRAATSLARLLAEQGKRPQAHNLLAPIYGWFTEGFGTADLKDAKALLEELRM